MFLVLNCGHYIKLEDDIYCKWGYLAKSYVEYSNQVGVLEKMTINHNCNILEVLNKGTGYYIIGTKIIPVKSVCYLDTRGENEKPNP